MKLGTTVLDCCGVSGATLVLPNSSRRGLLVLAVVRDSRVVGFESQVRTTIPGRTCERVRGWADGWRERTRREGPAGSLGT